MMRALIVGERMSVPRDVDLERYDRLTRKSPLEWLKWSRRCGAWTTGCTRRSIAARTGARKLERIGVYLHDDDRVQYDALNLLTPARSGAWDAARARAVGEQLAVLMVDGARVRSGENPVDPGLATSWRYDIMMLCGLRVAKAMDWDAPILEPTEDTRVLVLPHPSGMSRWWNDEAEVELGLDTVERFIERWRE